MSVLHNLRHSLRFKQNSENEFYSLKYAAIETLQVFGKKKKNGIFSQIILFGESFLQKRIGMGVAKQNQINSFKSIIIFHLWNFVYLVELSCFVSIIDFILPHVMFSRILYIYAY